MKVFGKVLMIDQVFVSNSYEQLAYNNGIAIMKWGMLKYVNVCEMSKSSYSHVIHNYHTFFHTTFITHFFQIENVKKNITTPCDHYSLLPITNMNLIVILVRPKDCIENNDCVCSKVKFWFVCSLNYPAKLESIFPRYTSN